MDELVTLSAKEAVARLKSGAVSPLDLIDAAEARIAETDGALNAMPTLCFDRARADARRIMDNPPSDTPPHYLYGLPIAVKDLNEVEGVRTTFGSPIYADHVSEFSDYMVEKLRKEYADKVQDLEGDWIEDTLNISFQAMGFQIKSSVLVRDEAVDVQTQLPLAAMPFKGMVQAKIVSSLEQLLS